MNPSLTLQGPDMTAVALQDELLIAATDLDRLKDLLDHACSQLLAEFSTASAEAEYLKASHPGVAEKIATALTSAQIALQFQDLSTQLVAHVLGRMHSVCDALAIQAMPGDGSDDVLPRFIEKSCPVAQREMDAGSVELF